MTRLRTDTDITKNQDGLGAAASNASRDQRRRGRHTRFPAIWRAICNNIKINGAVFV